MKKLLLLLVVALIGGAIYVSVIDRSSRAFGPHELAGGHIRITMPGAPTAGLECTAQGPCIGQEAWYSRLRGWNTISARGMGFRPLAYAVGVTDLGRPPKVPEAAEMRARAAAAALLGLDTGHDFEVQRGQGAALGSSPATELIVSAREGEVIWREIQVGSRYYVAAIAHHPSVPIVGDAQRFFESYSLPKGY